MRVYEWGSEDGMKILLVHGDTTPAPMLGPIAEELVSRGCRVMMIGASRHLPAGHETDHSSIVLQCDYFL